MMSFKKLFLFLFFFSLGFFFTFFCWNFFLFFNIYYFFFNFSFLNCCIVGVSLTFLSFCFSFMVFFIVSLVMIFSEIYLEHYNVNKFFLFLFMFFVSMILLSLSNSFTLLTFSWDLLGVSSVILIMFYPNKTTFFNSFLTIFFNRVGDTLLILFFGFFLINLNSFFFIFDYSFFFIFLIFCSFTKSAQFPFSPWLPAAMSAPTPISAVVHSSTLVTAGIFILSKFIDCLASFEFLMFLFYFSLFSFFFGSLMANFDLDFKKMIAFSTLSQISMMIVFLSLLNIYFCLAHMIFHSIFKSLLFCSAGFIFMKYYNDQFSFFSFGRSDFFIYLVVFLSVFSMTGLTFSLSFFSKDFFIEEFNYMFGNFFFATFFSGSVFTLIYCLNFLSSISLNFNLKSFFSMKSQFYFLFLFYLSVMFFKWFFLYFFNKNFIIFISDFDVFFINFFYFFFIFFQIKFEFSFTYFFNFFCVYLFEMKFFLFELYSKILKYNFFLLLNNDKIFTSNFFFNFNIFFSFTNFLKLLIFLILLLFFILGCLISF